PVLEIDRYPELADEEDRLPLGVDRQDDRPVAAVIDLPDLSLDAAVASPEVDRVSGEPRPLVGEDLRGNDADAIIGQGGAPGWRQRPALLADAYHRRQTPIAARPKGCTRRLPRRT